jgi:predicted regulator of Ras-like GTPase activity (Roadblock/LC7/MglB family)
LKVIAPLFLAAKKNQLPPQAKIRVTADIPDLFFGFPQPATVPTMPLAPSVPTLPRNAHTNFYPVGKKGEMLAGESDLPVAPSPSTDFTSRQMQPKEVVAGAMALTGVVGAVIALPDGLRVASEVPADLNADTLAAFLPQIFERVNQSTRELRMGALNNVNFTVGNIPWKIFRVNSVYFAAFGRAGESLPTAQLAALATQIDQKKK